MLPSTPHFLWVTEFPLFSCHDQDKEFLTRGRRWSSTHHPFTAPMYEDLPAFYAGDYGRVRGQHYDLVLNGVEIGGGSVRIHDPAMQEYVFRNVLQVSERAPRPCSFFHSGTFYSRQAIFKPSPPYFFSTKPWLPALTFVWFSWMRSSGNHSVTWCMRSSAVHPPMVDLLLVSNCPISFALCSIGPRFASLFLDNLTSHILAFMTCQHMCAVMSHPHMSTFILVLVRSASRAYLSRIRGKGCIFP